MKKDLVVKSFYFQEEDNNEKSLGNLCVVAELSNSLSVDAKILNNLSNVIKQEFFSRSDRSTEQSLTEALKKGNYFLEKLSKQGNVRWLGNLALTVVSIKNFFINFSKIGNIKLLLLRGGEYHDIGENLESQKPTLSGPSQPFSNLASGQLTEGDKIIILTKDIFDFFHFNLAERIISLPDSTAKALSRILKEQKEEMKEYSGILFLISMKGKQHKKLPLFFSKIRFPFLKKIKKETFLILALIFILLLSYIIFK